MGAQLRKQSITVASPVQEPTDGEAVPGVDEPAGQSVHTGAGAGKVAPPAENLPMLQAVQPLVAYPGRHTARQAGRQAGKQAGSK